MSISTDPRENHLLAALPDVELARLLPFLELIPLRAGTALYASGESIRYLYFATDSIVSLLYGVEDGSSMEIAIVCNEGVVGLALYMGGETTLSRATVQSLGSAYRLKGEVLKAPFRSSCPSATVAIALHPGVADANGPTLGVYPGAFDGSAILSLAIAVLRSLAGQSSANDSRVNCQHAQGAVRRGFRNSR
jgi:CRP-like cAMP-binding protein